MRARSVIVLVALATTGLFTACGADGNDGASAGNGGAVEEGRSLAQSAGCVTCHSASGESGVGPGWGGLAGSEVDLEDGSTVRADAVYLRQSITDPSVAVVEGFGPAMPDFDLSDAEVDALVAYIESLGEG